MKIDPDEQTMRMRADPEAFYITDHYRNDPAMLVGIAAVAEDNLRDLFTAPWRRSAPKRMLCGPETGIG